MGHMQTILMQVYIIAYFTKKFSKSVQLIISPWSKGWHHGQTIVIYGLQPIKYDVHIRDTLQITVVS